MSLKMRGLKLLHLMPTLPECQLSRCWIGPVRMIMQQSSRHLLLELPPNWTRHLIGEVTDHNSRGRKCGQNSSEFVLQWSSFATSSVGEPISPVLSQHLTSIMFKEMIKQQFPLKTSASANDDLPPLSVAEQNALRYAAGYVCRNIRKKVERSSSPLKEELVLSIMDLLDNDDDATEENFEDWLNLVDRGGLWRVNDTMYMVFQSMEEVARAHLRRSNMRGLSLPGGKDLLISKITSDEDIQFHWCVAAAAFGEEEGKILLNMIIELWVTVRGFSLVSSWLEQFKQLNEDSSENQGLTK